MKGAPLRFLVTVLVLWTGARAAILLPDWTEGMIEVPEAEASEVPVTATLAPTSPPRVEDAPVELARRTLRPVIPEQVEHRPAAIEQVARPQLRQLAFRLGPKLRAPARPAARQAPAFGLLAAPEDRAAAPRWSASAWLLIRDKGDPALAPGGTLGGSQAGARLTYALGGGVSLSGRLYLPLRQTSGAELAAGIDWRPIRSLPVSLLAERRQRLGRDGRTAFALTAYGGGSRNLTPHVRLDLYGQAGIVGLKSRDLFADGAVRVSRRVGPVDIGAGAWGAAQPGAARLDAGPSLSWRLPVQRANLRLQADWRFRIAGDAAPGSGPALTLAADF